MSTYLNIEDKPIKIMKVMGICPHCRKAMRFMYVGSDPNMLRTDVVEINCVRCNGIIYYDIKDEKLCSGLSKDDRKKGNPVTVNAPEYVGENWTKNFTPPTEPYDKGETDFIDMWED